MGCTRSLSRSVTIADGGWVLCGPFRLEAGAHHIHSPSTSRRDSTVTDSRRHITHVPTSASRYAVDYFLITEGSRAAGWRCKQQINSNSAKLLIYIEVAHSIVRNPISPHFVYLNHRISHCHRPSILSRRIVDLHIEFARIRIAFLAVERPRHDGAYIYIHRTSESVI